MKLINAKPGRPDELNGLECPNTPDKAPPAVSGQHHGVHPNVYGWNWTNVNPGYNPTVVKRVKVYRPADTAQIVDGTDWHIHWSYANYVSKWDVYGENRLWAVAYRHNDGTGANITHYDGHAEYYWKHEAWPSNTNARKALWYVYK